jgi:hypothetical protein
MARKAEVDTYVECRTLRHAWEAIGPGDRRPEFGALVCLRCWRCGMIRYDKFSRITGDRIGNPQYVQPVGYRTERRTMASWRAEWADGLTNDLVVNGQENGKRRRK